MTIYRNANYKVRDYEATNIVACIAEDGRKPDGEYWVEATKYVLSGLTPLWIQNGVQYYGHL